MPIHTRKDGLDFPVIPSVTSNWMWLRFSCRVLDPEWISNEILWPSFSLKVRLEDHRNYFTWDFCCYFRSVSSLAYPSHTTGTSDSSSSKGWHWARRIIFLISSEFCMELRLKYSQKVKQPKVDLNVWTWLSYSSNSVSQSMGKHDHLRPPLKKSWSKAYLKKVFFKTMVTLKFVAILFWANWHLKDWQQKR